MRVDRFNLGMPLLVFLLLALVIVGLGYFVFQQQAGSLKARAQSELAAIADLKADQIASWRDERYGDAQTTSQDYFFQSAVTQWIQAGSPSDDRQQRLVERLTTVQQVYDYQDVALLDGRGRLRLSSSGESPTVSPFTQGLAVQATSTSTILFSDLYKAEEEASQPIHIDLFAPLFDRDRHVAGVLLFRIDPRRFLFPLIQSWPVPSTTAETMLVQRKGNDVLYLNELRHRTGVALAMRHPIGEEPLLGRIAVRGQGGQVEALDYRGVPVLAEVRNIVASPWFVVAKVDQQEVYAPVHARAILIAEFTFILLTLAGVSTALWWRQQAEIELQNYRAELEARVAERTAALEAEMEQRKRVEATLAQAQKLEAVGQLTAGIAHDFNNILTILLGNLEILKRVNGQSDPSRFEKLTTMMRSAIEQATRLTSQLLVFSRKVVLHPKTVMADHIVRDFLPMLERAVGEAIPIEIVADPALWPCHVDPTQLEAAMLNVVLNARDAMPQGGLLKIELRNVVLDSEAVRQWNDVVPGDYVSLSVTDTGTGIPGDVLPHLFEPFFTTKEVGKGSGMGLAMIWGFAKHSGGHVTVESKVGQGATVTLYLPRAEVSVVREEACAVEAAKRAGTGMILLVEDEASVAEVAEMMLTDLGYAVRTAASGVEALRILQNGLRPDLVMSDIVMPCMSGVELADEVQRRYPDVEVLLTSGYPDHVIALHGGGKLKFPLLSKPYQQRSLAEALASVLNET